MIQLYFLFCKQYSILHSNNMSLHLFPHIFSLKDIPVVFSFLIFQFFFPNVNCPNKPLYCWFYLCISVLIFFLTFLDTVKMLYCLWFSTFLFSVRIFMSHIGDMSHLHSNRISIWKFIILKIMFNLFFSALFSVKRYCY